MHSTNQRMNYSVRQQLKSKIDNPHIIWMEYIKVFQRIELEFKVTIYLEGYEIEIDGLEGDVIKANQEIIKLCSLYQCYDLQKCFQGKFYEFPQGRFQSYVKSQDLRKAQQRDSKISIILAYKMDLIGQNLKKNFGYLGHSKYMQQRTGNQQVLLFCKSDQKQYFLNQIENYMEKQNSIWKHSVEQTGIKKIERAVQIMDKLDAIWLFQYDKIQLIQKQCKVQIYFVENQQSKLNVDLVIESYDLGNRQKAHSLILDDFLKQFSLERVEVPIPKNLHYSDLFSNDLRSYVYNDISRKFPQMKQDELSDYERHRVIDSHSLRNSAQELDNKYKTKIVEILGDFERNNDYIYILGPRKFQPILSEIYSSYLQKTLKQQNQGVSSIKNRGFESYFIESSVISDNDVYKSQVYERENSMISSNRNREDNLKSEVLGILISNNDQINPINVLSNESSQVEEITIMKKFKILDQQEDLVSVTVFNTNQERFVDVKRFSNDEFQYYLRKRRFNNEYEILTQNSTLTFRISGSVKDAERFLYLANHFFNHGLLFQIDQQIFEIMTTQVKTLTQYLGLSQDQNLNFFSSDIQGPENLFCTYSDEDEYDLILKDQKSTGRYYFLQLIYFPIHQRESIMNSLSLWYKDLRKKIQALHNMPILNYGEVKKRIQEKLHPIFSVEDIILKNQTLYIIFSDQQAISKLEQKFGSNLIKLFEQSEVIFLNGLSDNQYDKFLVDIDRRFQLKYSMSIHQNGRDRIIQGYFEHVQIFVEEFKKNSQSQARHYDSEGENYSSGISDSLIMVEQP